MDEVKNEGPVQWPAWFYGPDGQSEIFHNEDEVPSGWQDHPSKVGGGKAGAADAVSDDNETVQKLMDGKTQPQLVDILEAAKEDDDSIEFLKSWPKLKLAKTIVAHDVDVDFDEE